MEISLDKTQTYIVKIEKIVPEGKSLAHINGRVIFINGGFPDETVKIQIYKNKKTYSEARLVEIIEPSSIRIQAVEKHYLICSPWQSIPYNNQIKFKKDLLVEAYKDNANTKIKIDNFYQSKEKLGYRTKLEFSFTEDKSGKIVLAFHKRGVNNEYEIIDGCKLGSEKMTLAAQKITERLNAMPGIVAKGLKSLVIRESKTNHKIIAILFYKFKELKFNIKLSDLDGLVDGIFIAYSTIKSPISTITELKYAEGDEFLEEKILNTNIRYPYDGFFQNNIPMFELALKKIVDSTSKSDKIVEIYSGSGSIGFSLANKTKKLVGIEIVPSAVKYASINKEINNINNYEEIELPDYMIQSYHLEKTDTLVLDPPRSGLHPKVIKKIIEAMPKKIIYLSCNPITQSRDYNLIKDHYKMSKIYGFDFYPNTLHMEALLILDKIS